MAELGWEQEEGTKHWWNSSSEMRTQGPAPMGLLRPESRSWVQARSAGGPNCCHGDLGLCPYSWGVDPCNQLNEDTQRAGTSLKASVHPHPPFRNSLFCSKAWDFDLGGVFSSCWSRDVLPAYLPPPPSPKCGSGNPWPSPEVLGMLW